MGEEKAHKAVAGDGGDKKKDAGAAPAPPQPIVLQVDLHCAGCAHKVKKAIKHAPGVEKVVTDTAGNKVEVTGPADAAELKERIEARTKKPVQIVSAGSAPPKKEKKDDAGDGGAKKADKAGGGGGEKKADKTAGEKPKEEKKKPKEPKEETVTLMIRLHCDGCIDRIKRRIYKYKGVKNVEVDAKKDLVKVTGTMDVAALPGYLKDKLSRSVEVVAPAKKDGGGGGGGKKDDAKDEKDKVGGEKKDKDKDKAPAPAAALAPMPAADAGMYQMPPAYGYMPYPPGPGGYYGNAHTNAATYYPNAGHYPPPTTYPYVHAPQMFSDENPNACSVM